MNSLLMRLRGCHNYNSISSPFSAARVTVYVYVQFPIRLHGICVSKTALAMCDAYVSTYVLFTVSHE
ncbi:hypothetical protein T4D_15828 [Trichinella pseudospiralis]|uniref:Uncharacterized protein n=1 Tax=Trichinella pseudospiralis TaxID=6337 RepID=A0A0V1EHK6_TRIPS|nr:hypothetical protein T4D_15828 [Trichinella pseudospiralis]